MNKYLIFSHFETRTRGHVINLVPLGSKGNLHLHHEILRAQQGVGDLDGLRHFLRTHHPRDGHGGAGGREHFHDEVLGHGNLHVQPKHGIVRGVLEPGHDVALLPIERIGLAALEIHLQPVFIEPRHCHHRWGRGNGGGGAKEGLAKTWGETRCRGPVRKTDRIPGRARGTMGLVLWAARDRRRATSPVPGSRLPGISRPRKWMPSGSVAIHDSRLFSPARRRWVKIRVMVGGGVDARL